MKKLFYPLFALAAMAVTNTSCSDELENGATNSNEVAVNFNVQLENTTGSRAVGDGKTAKELHYAVYKVDKDNSDGIGIGTEIKALRCEGTTTMKDDLTAEVKFTLVKGQTYNFLFWAQCQDGDKYYTIDYPNGTVKVKYTDADDASTTDVKEVKIAANDENRDAFFKVRKDLKINGPIEENIVLKRPFAQVNVGTSIGSLANAATAEVYIKQSQFVIDNVATKLNVYTGAVSEPVAVTYTKANIVEDLTNLKDGDGDLKDVDDKNYEYLAMNYILVNDQNGQTPDGSKQAIINAKFEIFGAQSAAANASLESINTFEIPNVPVQRNWRTNIIGDILNESVTFNIVIDPKFDNDYNYYTEKELAYAFASGGEVTLEKNVLVTAPFYASDTEKVITDKSIVINLNGYTLTYTGTDIMARLGEGASLTFNGPGYVNASDYIASANEGGTIRVNGGEYNGTTTTLFQANGGKIYVSGGMFGNKNDTYGTTYLFNHIDSQKNKGLIEITGGTFIGFNPAASKSESPAMNFVKYGYKVNVISTAIYEVVPNPLEEVAMNGGTYTLSANETLDRALTVTEDMTLDLGNYNLTSSQSLYVPDVVSALVCVKEGATLTIKGTGTIDGSKTDDYAVETRGGNINIESGTFVGSVTAAYAVEGTINILGGTFKVADNATYGSTYLLNLKDKSDARINVTGGTFVGFNPADNKAENPKVNFVVDGYASTLDGTNNYVVTVKKAAAGETVKLTTNGIIAKSVAMDGGTLDGDGYTLTQSETPVTNLLVDAKGAVTIKNLNIVGGNKAWYDSSVADESKRNKGPRALSFSNLNGDIVVDNVETSGVCYALNVNASTSASVSKLIVKNSTLRGWTSFGSGLASATFSNVKFAVGNYFEQGNSSNGYCRPYVDTRFDGCAFEKGFKIDENISGSTTYPAIVIKNCTLGGVAITKDNLSQLFEEGADLKNVTLM